MHKKKQTAIILFIGIIINIIICSVLIIVFKVTGFNLLYFIVPMSILIIIIIILIDLKQKK